MRRSSILSYALLVLGLAVLIPGTIVAGSNSAARHRDCAAVCYNGTCSAVGICHCYCDIYQQPVCECVHPW